MASSDLLNETHLADALEKVTDGHCTRLVRARWRARKLLITPTGRVDDVGGRPVTYSRLALIEARLVHDAGGANIDQVLVSLALRDRIENVGAAVRATEAGASFGYYIDDASINVELFAAAVRSGELLEFLPRPEGPNGTPGATDAYWLVPHARTRGGQISAARCIVSDLSSMPGAMADATRAITGVGLPAVLIAVFNVSAAVRAVDHALTGQ